MGKTVTNVICVRLKNRAGQWEFVKTIQAVFGVSANLIMKVRFLRLHKFTTRGRS